MRIFLPILLLTLTCKNSWAYPEFIGYGYSSCLTCHFNGNGGGALNDYGRALWSAEIASRWAYDNKVSNEQIAESSGFFGKTQLPDWIRPALKYRGASVSTNAFSSQQSNKFYNMQLDANLTLQNNLDGKYLFSLTYGHIPTPKVRSTNRFDFQLREYFLRVEPITSWWVYAGLVEKVFGIRNIDHTSYQRKNQGFSIFPSDDEIAYSQGLILHKVSKTWETSLNFFTGHPLAEEALKYKGGSLMHDFEVGDNKRMSVSVLSGKSELRQRQMLALSYKQQVAPGSAFMFEFGGIRNTVLASNEIKTGSYTFVEGFLLLTRGYHFRSALERHNESFSTGSEDRWRFVNGLLFFPLPRVEIRTDFELRKTISESNATDDVWGIQGQIHVSL